MCGEKATLSTIKVFVDSFCGILLAVVQKLETVTQDNDALKVDIQTLSEKVKTIEHNQGSGPDDDDSRHAKSTGLLQLEHLQLRSHLETANDNIIQNEQIGRENNLIVHGIRPV